MISFLFSYIKWHYSTAYFELARISGDFISFLFNFFSIPVLTRTLFSRWQMLGESYKKGFDIEEAFGIFALNFMMRVVGFVIRSITILVGLVVILFFLCVSASIFILWTFFPLVVVVFFVSGLRLLSN